MRRVVVVANKFWEADPLVEVLLADGNRSGDAPFARPALAGAKPPCPLGTVATVQHPVLEPPADPRPRATWTLDGAAVEVFCLQDLLGAVSGAQASSSSRKAEALGALLARGDRPAAVIAVGTAAHPEAALAAGSVVVGRRFFVHDSNGHRDKPNPESTWVPPAPDQIDGCPGFAPGDLSAWQRAVAGAVEARFVRAPLRPADVPLLVANDRYVAVGTVNVTDYLDYAWADAASLESFRAAQRRDLGKEQVGSVETTHAIIGLAAKQQQAAFVWVSGIANSAGHFGAQVGQRTYAQNFAAAHNAGVAVAWLVPEVVRTLLAPRPGA